MPAGTILAAHSTESCQQMHALYWSLQPQQPMPPSLLRGHHRPSHPMPSAASDTLCLRRRNPMQVITAPIPCSGEGPLLLQEGGCTRIWFRARALQPGSLQHLNQAPSRVPAGAVGSVLPSNDHNRGPANAVPPSNTHTLQCCTPWPESGQASHSLDIAFCSGWWWLGGLGSLQPPVAPLPAPQAEAQSAGPPQCMMLCAATC